MFKNKKRIIIVAVIVAIIILICIAINIYNQKKQERFIQLETERVLKYTSINEFKSIEEVFLYLNSEFISIEESKEENVDYIIRGKLKYNAEYNTKTFFENLIQYSAYVLQYKNFYIVDESKNINIFVLCNPEKETVVTYYINGNERYLEKLQNEQNIGKAEQPEITSVKVSSDELNQIMSNSWKTNSINIGTQDSTYRSYEIYFDEGYEIRKINGKVFNIVFTDKYNKDVLDNIKVKASKEETTKLLGKPAFESGETWGYKTEKFYIFFSDEQISVYPVTEYSTDKIIEALEDYKKTNDFQKYMNNIRTIWQDYDYFESTGNKIILQYTLKGIKFKYDSSAQNGVILYNNYVGLVNKSNTLQDVINNNALSLPEKMYYENTDLVFENEKTRIATLDDYTQYNNLTTETILNTSNKYKVNQDSEGKVMFISINKQAPNRELRELADSAVWYDDNTFIYSVSGKGIYMYDVQAQKYTTIVEGNDKYQIKVLTKENELIYDETSIVLEK